MKMTTCTAIAALLAVSVSACSRGERAAGGNEAAAEAEAGDISVLNGTWKVDASTIKFEGKPDDFLLQGGTYKCNSCIPPLTIAADGQYHAVADRPYYDNMAVKVVDDRTVEFRRRKGEQEVSSATMQVAPDGNAMTIKFRNATTPNAPPVEGQTAFRRAGPAPSGAHAISGQWTPQRLENISEQALTVTFRVDGNQVTMESAGQTYTAELGGPAVAIQGDTGGTTVKVAREGASGLRETLIRGGKEVEINTIVPSADGKSITFTSTDPRDGSKTSWAGTKIG